MMTIRIVHISDLHLGKDLQTNLAVGKLLGKIRDKYRFGIGESNYLLVTGDIVDDGTNEQYELAKRALLGFSGNIMLCPGNHDYAQDGTFFYSPGAMGYFDDLLLSLGIVGSFHEKKPVVRIIGNKLLTIGLDSVKRGALPFEISSGEIGKEQLHLLDEILSDVKFDGMKKMVYMHHRPEECTGKFSSFLILDDKDELLKLCSDRVDVLAFGHNGSGISEDRSNIPIFVNANSSVGHCGWTEIVFCYDGIKVQIF